MTLDEILKKQRDERVNKIEEIKALILKAQSSLAVALRKINEVNPEIEEKGEKNG